MTNEERVFYHEKVNNLRDEAFRKWLGTCPNGEFHSIENVWEDSATLGFTVDFAITRREADDSIK